MSRGRPDAASAAKLGQRWPSVNSLSFPHDFTAGQDTRSLRIAVRLAMPYVHRAVLGEGHAPWQRGSNESTHGLRRRYFPKGFDFSTVADAGLDAVADELNARPRERFEFATPTEQLSELLLR